MMALFGSVAHAPLAVMLMVAEMTDSLAMLAPAMLAIGIATLIVGDRSIYASQLRSRADSAAHRYRFALPLMAAIPAGDAARAPLAILRMDQTVATARARLEAAMRCRARRSPIVTGASAAAWSRHPRGADPALTVGEVAIDGTTISADDPLDDALGILADSHRAWAPVVAEGRLVGILSTRDALAAYRSALAGNVREIRSVPSGRSDDRGRGRRGLTPRRPSRRCRRTGRVRRCSFRSPVAIACRASRRRGPRGRRPTHHLRRPGVTAGARGPPREPRRRRGRCSMSQGSACRRRAWFGLSQATANSRAGLHQRGRHHAVTPSRHRRGVAEPYRAGAPYAQIRNAVAAPITVFAATVVLAVAAAARRPPPPRPRRRR